MGTAVAPARDRASRHGASMTRIVVRTAAIFIACAAWACDEKLSTVGGPTPDLEPAFARVRIRPTVYLVGEAVPRPAGDRLGVTQGSFAIEKRAGGHMFQLNFSNAFGTTMGQIARGGPEENAWFLGFNISRKFF